MKQNENKNSETIIGYSAFRLFDECYEYNENACFTEASDVPFVPASLKDDSSLSFYDQSKPKSKKKKATAKKRNATRPKPPREGTVVDNK